MFAHTACCWGDALASGWFRHNELSREIGRNAKYAPPDDQQIRRHIRHICQDLQLLCYLVMLLVFIELWKILPIH